MSYLPLGAFALSIAAMAYFGFRDRAEYRRKLEEQKRIQADPGYSTIRPEEREKVSP